MAIQIKKIRPNRDRRAGEKVGSTKTDIHISIDNEVYDRLFKFKRDCIGTPSYSGIVNTALDAFMEGKCY